MSIVTEWMKYVYMQKDFHEKYIHPHAQEIRYFVKEIQGGGCTIHQFIKNLLLWFDEQITYSRLNMPFFPLQRSDLDVLRMKSGTCGDFANLVVSTLISIGFSSKYALVTKDCYGDAQDHICAAVQIDGQCNLIDATLLYRKWHGYPCFHQEYELLDPEAFEQQMRMIENDCMSKADKWGIPRYAGLLYAPWVYDEVVLSTEDRVDSVFYLLLLNQPGEWVMYVNYMSYTKEKGHTPIMATIKSNEVAYQFSNNGADGIWDEKQWGRAYCYEDIPSRYLTPELQKFKNNMDKNLPRIIEATHIDQGNKTYEG